MLRNNVAMRFAARTSQFPLHVLGRTEPTRQTFRAVTAIIPTIRTYATPGRPKKGSVGESAPRSTRPRKTAADKTAETAAKKAALDAKKAAAAAKKEATASKKAGKATATKTKKKATTKAKKPKAKAAAKPKAKKAKKVLTPEQLTKRKDKAARAEISQLKVAALSPPKVQVSSGWLAFSNEKVVAQKGELKATTSPQTTLSSIMKDCAAAYKQLSPGELEHYNHIANEAKRGSQAAYDAWVLQHTPDQIREANSARAKLRLRLATKPAAYKWRAITDDRLVAKPLTPYLRFSVERTRSGDFRHIPLAQTATLVGQEWKSLDSASKQRYHSEYEQDHARYVAEYKSVYGHEVPPTRASPAATSTASA